MKSSLIYLYVLIHCERTLSHRSTYCYPVKDANTDATGFELLHIPKADLVSHEHQRQGLGRISLDCIVYEIGPH